MGRVRGEGGLIGCVDRVGCEGGLVEVLLGWVRGYIKR